MTSVRLVADGVLQLSIEEADALAADFNRVFAASEARLLAVGNGRLVCLIDHVLAVQTWDPQAALGKDVWNFLPSGADAGQLAKLSSEVEMWLFDHALNRQRAARGAAAIRALWFWGGGRVDAQAATSAIRFEGMDALLSILPWSSGMDHRSGAGIIVTGATPGSSLWEVLQRQWLLPAIDALRGGYIDALVLSANSRRYIVRQAPRWRYWRSPAWWEYFRDED